VSAGKRLRPVGALLIAAFALAWVGSACGAGWVAAPGLYAQAYSLLPESARTLLKYTGDCIAFAPSPSCADVYFALPHTTYRQRERIMKRKAAASGWRLTRTVGGPAGLQLFYRRANYTATVALFVDLEICGSRVRTCREEIQVVRH
jgi:hypothetical protein